MTAAAFAVPVGSFEVAVSPGAEATALPSARADRLDLVIRHNVESLHEPFDGVRVPWLRDHDVRAVGGGTWIVSIFVSPIGHGARWELAEGRLRFDLGPVAPIASEPVDDPFVTTTARVPASPPALALHPLWGDAWQLHQTAQRWPLVPPERGDLPVREDIGALLATPPSWAALPRYRAALRAAPDAANRAATLGRMAEAYLALGAPREARYYLGLLLDLDPTPTALLRAADADLRLGRVDDARNLCGAVRGRGVDGAALSCLARIALRTGAPDPTTVARALAVAAEGPVQRLLAAELLIADHRWHEAIPLLEGVARDKGWPLVWAQLGDARLAAGDLEAARDAWRKGALDRELAALMSIRLRLAGMLEAGPTTWGRTLGTLLERALRAGPEGLEARYLVAQVASTWGDDAAASDALVRFWDASPDLAVRSDVAERLIAACRARAHAAERLGRHVDRVALVETCWRPELDALVSNPDFLQGAADAYVALGLLEPALSTQQRALTVSTRRGAEDPAALLRLAQLYRRTGRSKEALDTLVWVERLGRGSDLEQHVAIERAAARAAAGDLDGALALLQAVPARSQAAGLARSEEALVLARAGRCDAAAPRLRTLLATSTVDPVRTDEHRVALARCALRGGSPDLARSLAATVNPMGATADEAAWIDGAAAAAAPLGKPPEEPLWRSVASAALLTDQWLADARARLSRIGGR